MFNLLAVFSTTHESKPTPVVPADRLANMSDERNKIAQEVRWSRIQLNTTNRCGGAPAVRGTKQTHNLANRSAGSHHGMAPRHSCVITRYQLAPSALVSAFTPTEVRQEL